MKRKPKTVYIRVRCIFCGKIRDIGPNEIKPDDYPMCDECYNPMVPYETGTK